MQQEEDKLRLKMEALYAIARENAASINASRARKAQARQQLGLAALPAPEESVLALPGIPAGSPSSHGRGPAPRERPTAGELQGRFPWPSANALWQAHHVHL